MGKRRTLRLPHDFCEREAEKYERDADAYQHTARSWIKQHVGQPLRSFIHQLGEVFGPVALLGAKTMLSLLLHSKHGAAVIGSLTPEFCRKETERLGQNTHAYQMESTSWIKTQPRPFRSLFVSLKRTFGREAVRAAKCIVTLALNAQHQAQLPG